MPIIAQCMKITQKLSSISSPSFTIICYHFDCFWYFLSCWFAIVNQIFIQVLVWCIIMLKASFPSTVICKNDLFSDCRTTSVCVSTIQIHSMHSSIMLRSSLPVFHRFQAWLLGLARNDNYCIVCKQTIINLGKQFISSSIESQLWLWRR